MSLLSLTGVHTYYGKVHVLKGVDMYVKQGEVVALIGGNGAGKSTILKTIASMVIAKKGSVVFNGKNPQKVSQYNIPLQGICYVPQGRRVFPNLTVEENLAMGAYVVNNAKLVSERKKYAYSLFPQLQVKSHLSARALSGGEQQMIAIARAVMLQPILLLLDEPSLGLSPKFKKLIFERIVQISKSGTTILIVEQNAKLALSIADRAYVLKTGEIEFEGKAKDIAKHETLKSVYLG
jgi:branched-chain amino acid transport system ATP-binding protein